MSDDATPQSALLLYRTEDGRTRVECRFEEETLWLSQVQLAELFQTSVPNINQHLKAIYAEGELVEAATIKSYLIVRPEGTRQVSLNRAEQADFLRLNERAILPGHASDAP